MTTIRASLLAAAVLVTAMLGIAIGYYVGTLPKARELHGPVAEVIALPFVLIALLGAVVLAVVASRRRDRLSRAARTLAIAPVWLLSALLVLWLIANLVPHGS